MTETTAGILQIAAIAVVGLLVMYFIWSDLP